MTDDRDVRRPKTPPAGVRAQTAVPQPVWDGDKTNPHAPLLDQVAARTQRISHTAESTLVEIEGLKKTAKTLTDGHAQLGRRLDAQDRELAAVKQASAYTAGKIDAIAENADAQRSEREAKRAHELKREKMRQTVKLVGAITGGIAAIIAGLVALAQVLH